MEYFSWKAFKSPLGIKVAYGVSAITARILSQKKNFQEGSASLEELLYLGEIARQPGVLNIGEIGFNAGFSSLAFLLANKKADVVSFDIGEHDSVDIAKSYIDEKFPGRHRLILGDSRETVPKFKNENSDFNFDLIFIDGGHDYEIASADIMNARTLCTSKTFVIIDDLTPWKPWGKGPTQAWLEAIERGDIIQEEMIKDGKMVEKIEPPGDRSWALGHYAK